MPDTYIQERLDSLLEIDTKIVEMLGKFSTLFSHYTASDRDAVVEDTEAIYSLLGTIAIDLRKEVKAMDDNIGVYDNRDHVMILPIPVDQKNTVLGADKLQAQLEELNKLEPEVLRVKLETITESNNNNNNNNDTTTVEVKEELGTDVKFEPDADVMVID